MTAENTTSMHDSPHPETILICSIRVIGDVILTTPLVGILKDAYPDAAIDLMIAAGTGSFLRKDPRVRNIIEVSSKNVGGKRSLREDIGALGRVFRNYDLAINMNASDRGDLAVVCAGRNVRVGFYENKGVVKDGWKKLLLSHPLPYDTAGHTAHLCNLVAEALGFHVSRLEVKLYWDDDDARFVNSRLETLPTGGGYFVIHPFARWEYKFWPMESFVRLSDDIARTFGLTPVWTAAPTLRECELLEQYAAQCRYQPISIQGEFSLNQMACLIAGAQLYLGLDTAVSHIAASTGVPMIALYGPTAMNRWFPWNNNAAADQYYDCPRGTFRNGHIVAIQQWCDHPGCVHERCTSPCIPRISQEEVIDWAAKLLVESGHVSGAEAKDGGNV
jgi:heptosyltransferase III